MGGLDILDEKKTKGAVYSQTAIAIGAFVGGPLAAGYLLIENYKALDQRDIVGKAWVITIISTVALFGLAFIIPEDIHVPNIVFLIATVGGVRQVYRQYQATDIEKYLENGGELHSNWRAFGISALVFALALSVFVAVFLLFEESESATTIVPTETMTSSIVDIQTRSYGDVGHVIVFDQSQITNEEIDGIASQFTALNFFDLENPKSIYLDIDGNNYEFSVTDPTADPQDVKTRTLYEEMRTQMDVFLSNRNVRILLMNEDLNEVLARFE